MNTLQKTKTGKEIPANYVIPTSEQVLNGRKVKELLNSVKQVPIEQAVTIVTTGVQGAITSVLNEMNITVPNAIGVSKDLAVDYKADVTKGIMLSLGYVKDAKGNWVKATNIEIAKPATAKEAVPSQETAPKQEQAVVQEKAKKPELTEEEKAKKLEERKAAAKKAAETRKANLEKAAAEELEKHPETLVGDAFGKLQNAKICWAKTPTNEELVKPGFAVKISKGDCVIVHEMKIFKKMPDGNVKAIGAKCLVMDAQGNIDFVRIAFYKTGTETPYSVPSTSVKPITSKTKRKNGMALFTSKTDGKTTVALTKVASIMYQVATPNSKETGAVVPMTTFVKKTVKEMKSIAIGLGMSKTISRVNYLRGNTTYETQVFKPEFGKGYRVFMANAIELASKTEHGKENLDKIKAAFAPYVSVNEKLENSRNVRAAKLAAKLAAKAK